MALEPSSNDVCVGEDHVLGFPDTEDPLAVVLHSKDGWVLEQAGRVQTVVDGDRVTIGGRPWRLSLPSWGEPTLSGPWASPISLRFFVSQDEEHVEIEVDTPRQNARIRNRVHHYTLLLLARQRLADHKAGLHVSDQGWMPQARVERRLRLDGKLVYQTLYRARRELAPMLDGSDLEIVERRHDAGQIRIGIEHLFVEGPRTE